MRRDEVIKLLAAARGPLDAFHVKSLFLFGSVARDEATAESDVALLVDFEQTPSLFEFTRLRRALATILGCRVDLVTRSALKAQLREDILREAIRAAWRLAAAHRGHATLPGYVRHRTTRGVITSQGLAPPWV